jgi:hypothetical protein
MNFLCACKYMCIYARWRKIVCELEININSRAIMRGHIWHAYMARPARYRYDNGPIANQKEVFYKTSFQSLTIKIYYTNLTFFKLISTFTRLPNTNE